MLDRRVPLAHGVAVRPRAPRTSSLKRAASTSCLVRVARNVHGRFCTALTLHAHTGAWLLRHSRHRAQVQRPLPAVSGPPAGGERGLSGPCAALLPGTRERVQGGRVMLIPHPPTSPQKCSRFHVLSEFQVCVRARVWIPHPQHDALPPRWPFCLRHKRGFSARAGASWRCRRSVAKLLAPAEVLRAFPKTAGGAPRRRPAFTTTPRCCRMDCRMVILATRLRWPKRRWCVVAP
jgi:hypothetical protein